MIVKSFVKRIFKRITALSLTSALLLNMPFFTNLAKNASAKDTEYVSDIVLSYGKTEDDARQWLKDNNYKIVEGDLNKGTKGKGVGYSDVNVVLMGYKTTTNEKKAVRDIELLGMTDGFKITDMDTILEKQMNKIDDSMDKFLLLADEYKKNYKTAIKSIAKGGNDCKMALVVHDLLNKYIEDDSNKGMGDVLLNDFTNETNKNTLKKIMVQANSDVLSHISNYLTMASGDNNKTWVNKMVAKNTENDLLSRSTKKYKSEKLAKNKLDALYANDTTPLIDTWDDLRERINKAKETADEITKSAKDGKITNETINKYFDYKESDFTDVNEKMSDEKILKAMDENNQVVDKYNERQSFLETLAVSTYLSGIKYKGKTLYDYFMKERDFSNDDDIYEAYEITEALSEGEKVVAGQTVNLFTLIKYSMDNQEEIWNDKKDNALEVTTDSISELETISIYEGVNREVFEGNVAITSLSDRRNADLFTRNTQALAISIGTLLAGTIVTGIGIRLLTYSISKLTSSSFAFSSFGKSFTGKFNMFIANRLSSQYGMTFKRIMLERMAGTEIGGITASELAADIKCKALVISMSIGVIISIVGVIVSAMSIWNIVNEAKASAKSDYSVEIPKYIIDMLIDTNGNENPVSYTVARCNRNEGSMKGIKQDSKVLKDYADINGDTGKYWVSLYTTKDKLAGEPILADSLKVSYGSNAKEDDSKQISFFEKRGTGANFTSETFCYNDTEKGTFVTYKTASDTPSSTENTSNQTGSMLLNSSNISLFFLGFLGGALVIFVLNIYFKKRKQK